MKKYLTFFKIRLTTGLQYRAAAWAGVATQFAWGGMTLLMFWTFYQNGENVFPMTFPELSSYIWLQQAFLALYMAWYFDNDIFNSITTDYAERSHFQMGDECTRNTEDNL